MRFFAEELFAKARQDYMIGMMFGGMRVEQYRYPSAMRDAEASLRMEGFQVTQEMREHCAGILRGEMTVAECLRRYYVPETGRERK